MFVRARVTDFVFVSLSFIVRKKKRDPRRAHENDTQKERENRPYDFRPTIHDEFESSPRKKDREKKREEDDLVSRELGFVRIQERFHAFHDGVRENDGVEYRVHSLGTSLSLYFVRRRSYPRTRTYMTKSRMSVRTTQGTCVVGTNGGATQRTGFTIGEPSRDARRVKRVSATR